MKHFLLILSLAVATTLSAQTTTKSAEQKTHGAKTKQSNTPGEEPVTLDQKSISSSAEVTQPPVYTFVDQMPKPGYILPEYLTNSLRYPDDARRQGVQGRVYVQFVVNEDGSISNAKIMRGISPDCDAEALRIVSTMPRWLAGKQNGKEVKVSYMVPVTFSIK